ncbi:MAG: hypothetical protein ACRED1_14110 [Limisphaerales bacterium]
MKFTRIRNPLAGWRDWEPNPIVVKELRQAVRSWAVTGMLLLFLAVLFVVSIGFFVVDADAGPDQPMGAAMFTAFAVVLGVASMFFIPLYLGIRVGAERQDNNSDLLYVSTLSPARIILGKFLCGAYIAVLFFSACMPFMAFTNLLRGVDLPTIFFILFYLFLIVCGINMMAIFFGCIPASRPIKSFLAMLGAFSCIYLIGAVLNSAFVYLRFGMGTTMGGLAFWLTTSAEVAVGAAVTGLFYMMSVALVSPLSSNRALPLRLYITSLWFLTGLLSVAWSANRSHSNTLSTWAVAMTLLLLGSLVVVLSNSDTLSQRVRRAIPRQRWKRFMVFPFFNGAAGGLVWVGTMTAATLLVFSRVSAVFPARAWSPSAWLSLIAAVCYVFAYALTALFIHRTFFPNRTPKIAGLLAGIITAISGLAPSVVLFFMNHLSINSIERLELGNVFNIFSMRDDNHLIYHIYFSAGWLAVAVLLNARWFGRQVRSFVPPPKEAPPVIGYETETANRVGTVARAASANVPPGAS